MPANTQMSCYSLQYNTNNTGAFSPNIPDMHMIQTGTANSTNASFTQNATDFFPAYYLRVNSGLAPLPTQPSNWWYYAFPPTKETQRPTLPAYTVYPRIP